MALFAFFDESGRYEYTRQHGNYLVFCAVVTANPLLFTHEFAVLRYELLAKGQCLERFHACEDAQAVRDRVFAILGTSMEYAIHSIIVRKNKVNPVLYKYGVYSIAYRTLLKYLVGAGGVTEIHILVDTVPDKSQQVALKQNLKNRADEVLAPSRIPYTVDHHSSSAHALLQAADYCAWAIYKKWHSNDLRSYAHIRTKIRNEFDIYERGNTDYY